MTKPNYAELNYPSLLDQVFKRDNEALQEWEKRARAEVITEDEQKKTFEKTQQLSEDNSPQKDIAFYVQGYLIMNTVSRNEAGDIDYKNKQNRKKIIQARNLYTQASELNYFPALRPLAKMCEGAIGGPKDEEQAAKLYKKEAELGGAQRAREDLERVMQKTENKRKENVKQAEADLAHWLKNLQEIKDSWINKAQKNKKYAPRAKRITQLCNTVKSEVDTFLANPTPEGFKQCNERCLKAMNDMKTEAAKHLSFWYGSVPSIIRKILGVLAILTIVPAIITYKKAKHGFVYTFFKIPETKASNKMDEAGMNLEIMLDGMSSLAEDNKVKPE